jgi:hypothetical protein
MRSLGGAWMSRTHQFAVTKRGGVSRLTGRWQVRGQPGNPAPLVPGVLQLSRKDVVDRGLHTNLDLVDSEQEQCPVGR